jgi:hypothetical protein
VTWQDLVNGGLELTAGLAVFNHCRVLYRDKALKGVSVFSTAFFTAWGFWNLYYYPHLGQTASFIGGVSIVLANALWLGLMVKYRGNR